ncbi:MAG: hypothetical protein CMK83_04140 [Pseudomonadales bacterium]|jgi:demethylmenaquinone methyltransferase / 2-methoxy-6-polyprenyl-1,4-benzoquinol methylase|uniref:class I SAM-dependent methyltransferase n=1 Tax=unclassified Ketobacter TaxID=2639109 RepID=UPI000C51E4A8|nr:MULTISPECIES: methyltransferase domain-containing protein [unclassified Ketobacter]MAA60902.1 hypothetical protein [Pseudomonadales bacterium]MEC8812567.1 methyltransferase domain-containing protein [Pseudomonadota bacterium]TNC83834.1 MAG: hypothetical protein CSH49_20355 [Alcanivorax sp.]HAU15364.1 hypothetical protein [Gammaproteobacteria bacterium]MAQ23389.1 hypothetical protein [Pseudomonadales bacterium]|tara:strand:+ start:1453 stop:2100 length:648 start_codon:yes stop_codon:yes gene_type:complete
MNTEIVDLYNKIGGESYNKRGFSPFSFMIKRQLLARSNLGKGDRVLVLFCGSGQDFKPILDVIGEEGEIIGVDFSKAMLDVARRNLKQDGINNVTLIEADVLTFQDPQFEHSFDAVFCSMGIALNDNPYDVYSRLEQYLKDESQIIIFDLKYPSTALGKFIYKIIIERITNHYGGNRLKHIASSGMFHNLIQDKRCRFSREYIFGAFFSVILNRS